MYEEGMLENTKVERCVINIFETVNHDFSALVDDQYRVETEKFRGLSLHVKDNAKLSITDMPFIMKLLAEDKNPFVRYLGAYTMKQVFRICIKDKLKDFK